MSTALPVAQVAAHTCVPTRNKNCCILSRRGTTCGSITDARAQTNMVSPILTASMLVFATAVHAICAAREYCRGDLVCVRGIPAAHRIMRD